jgi:hypothetical protein
VTQAWIIIAAILAACSGGPAKAEADVLQPGSYEVRYRLELPHVEQWAITRTATICIPGESGGGSSGLRVLSGNNPLAACATTDAKRAGSDLTFRISCEGRGAARAFARYRLGADAFAGRIAMVMGGKNMTMTEVQAGRRVGTCDEASPLMGR